jgi:CRP-like cAMP-binding protein
LTEATILQVPHAALCRVIDEFPNLALAFWRDGTADASIIAKWVGNLGRQDARARLAHLLCEFGIRMEQAGLGTRNSFELRITQEQMADALGLTPVHVNRTLQRLRAEGLVVCQAYRIEVDDWNALVDAAEFDPSYLLLGKQDDPGRNSSFVAATSAVEA